MGANDGRTIPKAHAQYFALWKEDGGQRGIKTYNRLHYTNVIRQTPGLANQLADLTAVTQAEWQGREDDISYHTLRKLWIKDIERAFLDDELQTYSMLDGFNTTCFSATPKVAKLFANHPDIEQVYSHLECSFMFINVSRPCYDDPGKNPEDIGITFAERCTNVRRQILEYLDELNVGDQLLFLEQCPTTAMLVLFVAAPLDLARVQSMRFAWQVMDVID